LLHWVAFIELADVDESPAVSVVLGLDPDDCEGVLSATPINPSIRDVWRVEVIHEGELEVSASEKVLREQWFSKTPIEEAEDFVEETPLAVADSFGFDAVRMLRRQSLDPCSHPLIYMIS